MQYRIVCTTQVPVTEPTTHAHIGEVGTGNDPDKADKRWKLAEVVAAIDTGQHTFYTKGAQSGKTANVVTANCPSCAHRIIRSTPDAVSDNNLDSLRKCRWS